MWNYRLVRRVTKWKDKHGKERIDYSYGIHEAFMDKNGKVTAITEDAIEVCGSDPKECRHAWSMMVEAFGYPILDYDKIPEEGVDQEDPLVKPIDKQELCSAEESKEITDSLFKDFDHDAYEKECEKDRIKCEKDHKKRFGGVHPRKKLAAAVIKDYLDHQKKQKQKRKGK